MIEKVSPKLSSDIGGAITYPMNRSVFFTKAMIIKYPCASVDIQSKVIILSREF
jgi:hypothetical protein